MNIQIKPELEQIIQAQIATGRYANPEEVISKAFKLLLEWEKGYQEWVEETREKVEVAIEQLNRGEGIDGEKDAKSLAECLDIRPSQMQDWLNRSVNEGRVRKINRPVAYVVNQPTTQLSLL